MKNFFIYGDSYFEECEHDEEYVKYSWLVKLKNNFKNKYCFFNYAQSGTGPHYSFDLFNDHLFNENKIYAGDIVLFHLSHFDRIQFITHPSLTYDVSTRIKYDFINNRTYIVSDWTEGNDKEKKLLKYYEMYKKEIEFFFMTISKQLLYENSKNLSFLYSISLLYDIKIIVFANDLSGEFDNFFKLNYNNFFFSPVNLFDLSYREIFKEQEYFYREKLYLDLRRNHLSPENHEKMFEYLLNILNNDYKNLPKFKTNFKDYNDILIIKSNNNKKDFIYE